MVMRENSRSYTQGRKKARHNSHQHQTSLPLNCKQEGHKKHILSCKTSFEVQPSKAQGKISRLNIALANLQPLDWISTDIFEKVISNGKRFYFLVKVDRASGFLSAYKLKSKKIKHVIEVLHNFSEAYCGPPYIITSEGGHHPNKIILLQISASALV